MNIVELIKKETAGYLNKLAVIDGTKKISYRQIFSTVDKIASELKCIGVKPFQRVALLCNDSIDHIVLNLAILLINGVVVPIFPSLSEDEISEILKRIQVNFLISEKQLNCVEKAKRNSFKYDGEKNFSIYAFLIQENIPKEFYKFNPAFIRFSSGTTGINKGVVISHEAIVQRTDAANKGLKVTPDDLIIWVLSMSFHFVVTILLFLRRSATIVLCSGEFPESLIEGLKRHKTTFIYASPFHYYMLSHTSAFSSNLLSDVRLAISTATKLNADIASKFFEKFKFDLCQAYGIIEVGLPFLNYSLSDGKRASVGTILPDYELKIENSDSQGIGEVYIRGKGMFDAYFSPWQTRKELSGDDWFKTGDMGKLDKDGYLYLVGRSNKVINFCGMKIFPFEVESVINQHPAVLESLVFGVVHAQYGQLPMAKVVLTDVKVNIDRGELKKFCHKRLAPHKVPKEFISVTSLDKTLSGKLKR